jgi:hypothetical protein
MFEPMNGGIGDIKKPLQFSELIEERSIPKWIRTAQDRICVSLCFELKSSRGKVVRILQREGKAPETSIERVRDPGNCI